jgi:hypothetical protein
MSIFKQSSRILRLSVTLIIILGQHSAAYATYFTTAQLSNVLARVGIKRILKIETFTKSGTEYLLVFGTTGYQKQQIVVFRDDSLKTEHPGLVPQWQSGPLPYEMLVTVTGMPYVQSVGNSDVAILYSGCTPHLCPDELGAIVYSLEKHEIFKAIYVADRKPKLKYSPNVMDSGNREYKKLLDGLLQEHNVEPDKDQAP